MVCVVTITTTFAIATQTDAVSRKVKKVKAIPVPWQECLWYTVSQPSSLYPTSLLPVS